ncbi:MAG: thiolase family protein [Gammaproteobacteria bacterium PRO9]|nr:thiolase family protein [Gammaproteobacteria bacterium PRO9]
MSAESVVFVAARRTAIGTFQGALESVPAPELFAAAARACLADSGIEPADIGESLIGCVLQAGLGQAPARQASLAAGLPVSVPTTTVNKVCGSGMKSVHIGTNLIRAGAVSIVLAGGMESMSHAPYLLPGARKGYRMGHQQVLDHMFRDGLQNPYDGNMMGFFGEATAKRYGFSRAEQDAFAIESVERALAAIKAGAFASEIAPVTVKSRNGETVVDMDEEPGRCHLDRIPTMRPAFAKDGTITAASSSSISDGAAAVILTSAAEAARRGLKPLARIVAQVSHAQEPEWFTTAPGPALTKLLKASGWSVGDVDLFEVNEAFACVSMAAMRDVGIPRDRLNVNGGACALGHPIGATGTRLLVTLINALKQHGGRRGVASACIGGGEAIATAIELL